MSAVAQLRLLARAFARQLGFRITFRFVRLVAALLPMKIHAGISGILRRRPILFVLPLKTFQAAHASSSVPSTVKCSSEVHPFSRACATTRARNSLASSASSNRSRFLEAELAKEFLARVVAQAREKGWTSDEHFTVDGTLLEAWAA